MGPTVHPIVWASVLLLVAVEAVLWLGDAGFLPAWREPSFLLAVGAVPPNAAFSVPGALPWFLGGLVGHALLHAGWMHLAFNAAGLLCLGHVVQAQAGTVAYLVTCLVTAVAGAVTFLAIGGADSIMIGASGAVFGLLGVVLRWRSQRVALWRVLLVLALLTIPAGLLVGGAIAWQAHLGGFLAGWLLGRVFPMRRRILHPLM